MKAINLCSVIFERGSVTLHPYPRLYGGLKSIPFARVRHRLCAINQSTQTQNFKIMFCNIRASNTWNINLIWIGLRTSSTNENRKVHVKRNQRKNHIRDIAVSCEKCSLMWITLRVQMFFCVCRTDYASAKGVINKRTVGALIRALLVTFLHEQKT